jgi:hypothetical protein
MAKKSWHAPLMLTPYEAHLCRHRNQFRVKRGPIYSSPIRPDGANRRHGSDDQMFGLKQQVPHGARSD